MLDALFAALDGQAPAGLHIDNLTAIMIRPLPRRAAAAEGDTGDTSDSADDTYA